MKAIKYVLMGVLMLGFGTSVKAQDGSKADVDAVKKIISSKPADLAKQMKPFYKANKKNAENLIAFGRAFFEVKDTANARIYAEYALQASKNKCAPAYILLGDIAALADDGGAAAAQYDQAIYADPKLVDAYYKYALVYRKIDPRGAARKLDELKAARPDISVDAIKGHIFMISGDRKSAYEAFKQVPVENIDPSYLNEFARASYFGGHFDDALKACEQGLKNNPGNPTFTRLAMFSNYELKNYDAAKTYLHKYFNEIKDVEFSEYDHYYAALIHEALNDKENAKASYHKALDLVSDSSMIKRWDILKTLAQSHQKDGDLDNAIKYYQEFLGCKPEVKVDDYETLADIYSSFAKEEADDAAKVALLKKAAEVYATIGEKFPIQQAYASYKRAELINKTDKDMAGRLAKADYQKVVDLLGDKADRSKSENTMLKYSLHYLMFGSYLDKNIPAAKSFAEKILTIDPEYNPALEILKLK
ncbi:MAG: tetratricopeptide repeat protein [Prevotella sp.]|jgi:tetratricopeptide (TPR) repeat protein|nr:tetratricopeptide repeat protein [Prevotella sp.]